MGSRVVVVAAGDPDLWTCVTVPDTGPDLGRLSGSVSVAPKAAASLLRFFAAGRDDAASFSCLKASKPSGSGASLYISAYKVSKENNIKIQM